MRVDLSFERLGERGERRGIRAAAAGRRHLTRTQLADHLLGDLRLLGGAGDLERLQRDAAAARARLKTNPWIAEASVAKLYPGRLQIEVTERKAFALWQKDRKIWVISADGIVLEPYLTSQFASLPLVVGVGAERKGWFRRLLGR